MRKTQLMAYDADLTLRGRDLTRTFGDGETVTVALRDASLDLFRGQFALLMGPSGSGKSTLLNVLGCLDRPTYGDYILAGQNVAHMDRLFQ